MAVWRTKAYSLFLFKPGDYSFAHGKRDLFADLVERARLAIRENDMELLRQIVEYVTWAADQNSDELASVADLSFFLPIFKDAELCGELRKHLPEELVNDKWRLLMESPSG